MNQPPEILYDLLVAAVPAESAEALDRAIHALGAEMGIPHIDVERLLTALPAPVAHSLPHGDVGPLLTRLRVAGFAVTVAAQGYEQRQTFPPLDPPPPGTPAPTAAREAPPVEPLDADTPPPRLELAGNEPPPAPAHAQPHGHNPGGTLENASGDGFLELDTVTTDKSRPRAVAPRVAVEIERCESCGASIGTGASRCRRCGWEQLMKRRSCPTCDKDVRPAFSFPMLVYALGVAGGGGYAVMQEMQPLRMALLTAGGFLAAAALSGLNRYLLAGFDCPTRKCAWTFEGKWLMGVEKQHLQMYRKGGLRIAIVALVSSGAALWYGLTRMTG